MPPSCVDLAREAAELRRTVLRGVVLERCVESCDPVPVAESVAALGASDDALADALFFACASEVAYLPFYGDIADVVCRLRGPGASHALLRAAMAMGEHPKKHAVSLVADLVARGVVDSALFASLVLPGPLARRLRVAV